MGTVGLALVVGGMALLFSGLVFLVPVRGRRPPPQESFEISQERIEQYLREMRRTRGEIDSWEEASTPARVPLADRRTRD
jgi:hypothetical protein